MESVVAKNVKRYSMRFRQRVVERMQLEKNIVQLSRELGLDRSMMYIWKRKLEKRRMGTSGQARSTCGIGR